jgi:hypothetical protein
LGATSVRGRSSRDRGHQAAVDPGLPEISRLKQLLNEQQKQLEEQQKQMAGLRSAMEMQT